MVRENVAWGGGKRVLTVRVETGVEKKPERRRFGGVKVPEKEGSGLGKGGVLRRTRLVRP